jgi:hypothetical protein
MNYARDITEDRQKDIDPEVLAGTVSFSQTLNPSPPAQLISTPWLG